MRKPTQADWNRWNAKRAECDARDAREQAEARAYTPPDYKRVLELQRARDRFERKAILPVLVLLTDERGRGEGAAMSRLNFRHNRAMERLRTWRAIREYRSELRNGTKDWQTTWDDFEAPQKIRVVRQGNLLPGGSFEGRLVHGRVRDAAQFTPSGEHGLHWHLGHDSILEKHPKTLALHDTISDGTNTISALKQVAKIAKVGMDAVRAGMDLFVSCDVGCSRSVAALGLLISLLEDVPMDDNLRRACANPAYADWKEFGLGNIVVWNEFKLVREYMEYPEGTVEMVEEVVTEEI